MSDDVRREPTEAAEIAAEALRHLAWLADAGIVEAPAPTLAVSLAQGEVTAAHPRSGAEATATASIATSTPTPQVGS